MSTMDAKEFQLHPPADPDDQSSYTYRQLIGLVGFALPLAVWLVTALRPFDPASRWHTLGSISAYYYSGAVTIFTGGLCAMAFFLFGYRGYQNSYGPRDRLVAIIAAIAALGAAFFPTDAPPGLAPTWWTTPMRYIHLGSGILLFASFTVFALVLFPKSKSGQGDLPRDKQVRNFIYRGCGVIIILSMIWAAIAQLNNNQPIFLPETVALEFFALSWLVKGRAEVTVAALGRRTAHYARHPQQFVDDTRTVIRRKQGLDSASA